MLTIHIHALFHSCMRGASFCVATVCTRPGQQPPAPAPTPAPAPAPAPTPAPTPAPVPEQNNDPNARPALRLQDAVPTVYDSYLNCGPPRTRREVRDLSQEEWTAFVNALNELRNRPSLADPSRNQFEDMARIHQQFVREAHGGSYFLPWHRLFVLLLENLLREVDPTVSVPYWNWAIDAEDPAMSVIWQRTGGSTRDGNGQPTCIPNMPWQNLDTNHGGYHCVRRGFVSGGSGSMIQLDNWLTIQALMDSNVPFSNFATALEATHGRPHVGVGGDMGVLGTAPNDPMFFLHHCFVDYVYARWEYNGNGDPERFDGVNPGISGRVRRGDLLGAFQKTVRHAQSLRCIEYAEFSGNFTFTTDSGSLNTTVDDLPEEFVEKNHLNKTRLDEGRAILQQVVDDAVNGHS